MSQKFQRHSCEGKSAPLEKKKGSWRSFEGIRCKICKHIVIIETFGTFSTQREHCINPNNLNCRSSNILYNFSCKAPSKQYTCCTERFWSRFNNCKSAHINLIEGNTIKQALFHAHFEDEKHGMSDWEITLTEKTDYYHYYYYYYYYHYHYYYYHYYKS